MARNSHRWHRYPFDIYPEQSDEPPPNLVQPSLESLLGDLARNDPTKTAYQLAAKKRWQDILRRVGLALGTVFLLVLLGLYAVRYGRQLYFSRASASTQQRYRMLLDELATLGFRRQKTETRTEFAQRLASVCPSLSSLTHDYQSYTFGRNKPAPSKTFLTGLSTARKELKTQLPLYRRLIGLLNPISWWRTR